MGGIILDDAYVEKLIEYLLYIPIEYAVEHKTIDLAGVFLYFSSIGVSEDIFNIWSKEILSKRVVINEYIIEEIKQFFIKKYREWMYSSNFEVKVDLDLAFFK